MQLLKPNHMSLYFYGTFLEHKWIGIKKVLSYFILYIAGVGNAIIIESLPQEYIPWKMVTLILLHMLYIKICYRSTWVMSGFFSSLAILIEFLFGLVIIGLLHISYLNNQVISSCIGIISYFIMILGVYVLRKKLVFIKQHLRDDPETLMKYTWLPVICVIPGVYFYVFFIRGEYIGYFNVFVSVVLIIINVASLFYLQDAMIKDDQLRLSEVQNKKNQNQLQAFRDMQSLYERQGRKLHDYKKQLSTLQELMKSGDIDTALEFTEQLTKSIAVEMSEINVGHPIINAVLNQQYRVAKGKGIGMTFAISDLKDIKISDDEIVVMLGNLIENAIHECEKVVALGQSASISVKFVEKDGTIILNVRNPIMQKVAIENNKVITPSQDGHGIGLSNVELIAEKNGGTFAISCDDKDFVVAVVI